MVPMLAGEGAGRDGGGRHPRVGALDVLRPVTGRAEGVLEIRIEVESSRLGAAAWTAAVLALVQADVTGHSALPELAAVVRVG